LCQSCFRQSSNSAPTGISKFLKTVITGDESWVYGYYPETKVQSSQRKHPTSPRPKKARQVRTNMKKMLFFFCFFFDYGGLVHCGYTPLGLTVNKEYYQEVLCHLRAAVRRKRPKLWEACNWQLHHDNAPANSSHLIQGFLAKHSIPQVHQAPYSPDMVPCDFWQGHHIERDGAAAHHSKTSPGLVRVSPLYLHWL
jgi:histone-lysine N-methyltransferase SETMAR